ncbi:TrbI F-type domain-containing protein [Enterovibrio paralichthyis]|uniref:TrbI F-type domain-containing protein n=1 Tax=Enterovibrio paralichthyis TaxID=2853805 RepID=UPI001C47D8B7|nr:TrbI F-type domain-containing protein [Enterovibrio paralichthyis]MBV7300274.1 type-F conjugative transfer system protein TrbI [Enterovibrio paralichthyis]
MKLTLEQTKNGLVTIVLAVIASAATTAIIQTLKPTPPQPPSIVTVDIEQLIRTRSDEIARSGNGEITDSERKSLIEYTEQIQEKLVQVSEHAGVIVLPKQAVIAGAERDITALIGQLGGAK